MPSKTLFRGATPGPLMPPTDTTNLAGGIAYKLTDQEALAIYAATGCLNGTYYAGAEMQLDTVLKLARACAPEFVAKVAVYARKAGAMKDMPALLCAYLAGRKDNSLTESVFARCIDNGKQLRTFVQMLRSGQLGRKSMGTRPRRFVSHWFNTRTPAQVWNAQVGDGGMRLRDVLRLGRPKPATDAHAAVYRYLLEKPKPEDEALLPEYVKAFATFRAADPASRATLPLPNVNFQLLTDLELTVEQWRTLARQCTWQQARQNLNALGRHDVWTDQATTEAVAALLANPEHVRAARAFPHQLLMAYAATLGNVPAAISAALQDALDVAVGNVPELHQGGGALLVCLDVSGSMGSPVTGHRAGGTTKVRCVDVAALMAAAAVRKNPRAVVVPFDTTIHSRHGLNPRDSVLTNATRLAAFGGGGTDCHLPLQWANAQRMAVDAVLFLSDLEGWVDSGQFGRQTGAAIEWAGLKLRCPKARMVCINVQPQNAVQVPSSPDVLNIGGFNDAVWEVAAAHFKGEDSGSACIRAIESVEV